MQEWTTVPDKREQWGEGMWVDEPDKVVWVDADTGLDCMLKRHETSGHWCGYVGVGPDHPLHGVEYNDPACYKLDVHGGLTFSRSCSEPTMEQWQDADTDMPFNEWCESVMPRRICHVPEPGRPDDVWWLGFDCAHLGDIVPSRDDLYVDGYPSMYRSRTYVERETRKLAKQVAAYE